MSNYPQRGLCRADGFADQANEIVLPRFSREAVHFDGRHHYSRRRHWNSLAEVIEQRHVASNRYNDGGGVGRDDSSLSSFSLSNGSVQSCFN